MARGIASSRRPSCEVASRNSSRRPSLESLDLGSCSKVQSRSSRFASQERGRSSISQERGRPTAALDMRRPSTSCGLAGKDRPPLPSPPPRPTSSVGLPRRGSLGCLAVASKPALVAACGQACPNGSGTFDRPDMIDGHQRKLPLKSFQGALGETWGQFSWRRPESQSRGSSTRASSRSSLSAAASQVLHVSSTPSAHSTPRYSSGMECTRLADEMEEIVLRRSSPPPSPRLSPRSAADQEAAAQLADMDNSLHEGALFVAISLSTAGYEAQPLAILRRPDFCEHNQVDFEECSALHLAAQKGLTTVCKELLNCPTFEEADAQDRMGRTALHSAAAKGHDAVCKLILSHSRFKAASARNINGCTALHSAACGGSPATCSVLLDDDTFEAADVQDNDGQSALHWAAWNGHVETCQLLLEHPRFRAINHVDYRGRTPLHLAATYGWSAACREIAQHRRFKGVHVRANDGSSAFDVAVNSGHGGSERVLLEFNLTH